MAKNSAETAEPNETAKTSKGSDKQVKKNLILKIFIWYLGISFFLFGFTLIFEGSAQGILAGILMIIASAFTIPPVFSKVCADRITSKQRYIAIGICLAIASIIMPHSPNQASDEQANSNQGILPTYTVIDEQVQAPYKRSVDIHLKKRVSKNDLEKIAYRVKNSSSASVERTFINYYLGQRKGVWAQTHFNPSLKIEVAPALPKMKSYEDEIIGVWEQETFGWSVRRILFKTNDGQYYRIDEYDSGFSSKATLDKKQTSNGDKYSITGDNVDAEDGVYYLVSSDKSLSVHDKNGLISDGLYYVITKKNPQKACSLLDAKGFERDFVYKNTFGSGEMRFTQDYYTCLNQKKMSNSLTTDFVVKGQADHANYYKIVVYGKDQSDIQQGREYFKEVLKKQKINTPDNLDLSANGTYTTATHTFHVYSNAPMHHAFKVYQNDVPEHIKSVYESE